MARSRGSRLARFAGGGALAVLAASAAVAGMAVLAGSARADTSKTDRVAVPLCEKARSAIEQTDFTADEAGNFRAAGTWRASGGATGVYIEFRIDSDRYGAEWQRGASGSWAYRDSFPECSFHTQRVHAYPVVTVGGRQVICLSKDQSVFGNFNSRCLAAAEIVGCTWKCQPGPPAACSGTCIGQASGDHMGYAPFWGLNDSGYSPATQEGRSGPWTERITCAPGQTVTFKVRGHAGAGSWSPIAEIPCGAEKPAPKPAEPPQKPPAR